MEIMVVCLRCYIARQTNSKNNYHYDEKIVHQKVYLDVLTLFEVKWIEK